jgi:flagella basal body P-ring formation protein FlgA
MRLMRARLVLKAAIAAFAAACALPAAAQDAGLPTPKTVIYPGDLILDQMLIDVPDAVRDGRGPFVSSRALIVGRVARLTLLPGHAIPFAGSSSPRAVS